MDKKEITIRLATREDAALIESFIRKLATYEDALYRTTVTPELVEEWMFDKKKAEVAFAMIDGKEACGVYRLEEEGMREVILKKF